MSHRKDKKCAGCGSAITGGKTGYCYHCWAKYQQPRASKYPWTPEWDEMLRDGYARCVLAKPTTVISRLQAITGYPRHAVTLRAQALGITRDTRKPWTDYEIGFLRQHVGRMSIKRFSRTLGRSYESVRYQLERLELKAATAPGYSIAQLADLMGIGRHQVRKFIQRGWLGLDADHRIPKRVARELLFAKLDHLDLRVMNQRWLKDELRIALSTVTSSIRRAA